MTDSITSRYIPPKIKKLGDELRRNHDFSGALHYLKDTYPKLTSYQTAINRLRAYLIATEEHHPQYESSIKKIENELVSAYTQSLGAHGTEKGDEIVLDCIRFLYDFKAIPLRRQLNVIHKLKRKELSLPTDTLKDQIQAVPLLPEYVQKLQLTFDEQNSVKQITAESQRVRSSNVITIHNPNDIVKMCNAILRKKTESFENVCTALALLTGRRTIEILLTGEVGPIVGGSHFATFKGQVKTGLQSIESVTSDSPKVYIIPLLGSARVINKRIKEVQELVKKEVGEASKEAINQKFSHKLSQAVKSLIHPHMRFHDLRSLYALISYEAFKPHTYGLNGWVCKVLGHNEVNMSTHYTRMQIGQVSRVANMIKEFD